MRSRRTLGHWAAVSQPLPPGAAYTIKIRRWSGTDTVWYGIAWNTRTSPLIVIGDLSGLEVAATER